MKQRFLTWLGIALAGFFLGSFADSFFHSFPVSALAAMFTFLGIAGLATYRKKVFRNIPGKESGNGYEKRESDISEYPLIEADLEKIRKAVKKFADGLPKGVYRTILVQEDNSIDFKQIAHILGGYQQINIICPRRPMLFLKRRTNRFRLKWIRSKKP